MNMHFNSLTRREALATIGTGVGFLALPSLLQADTSSAPVSTHPLAPRSPDRGAQGQLRARSDHGPMVCRAAGAPSTLGG